MTAANASEPTPAPPARRWPSRLIIVVISVWLLGIAVGLSIIWRYEGTPGRTSVAPREWPTASTLARHHGRPTVVMFVHPHCTCSRASLIELRGLLEQLGTSLDAYIVFLKPAGTDDEWEHTGLWQSASTIPALVSVIDRDGAEAARFGVQTSGDVRMYDADGALAYSGGITGARGHVGDNAGLRGLIAALEGHGELDTRQPVFGCSFRDADARGVDGP